MFAELLEADEIKNLFLEDYQHVERLSVSPIKGRGKNYLVARCAQPSCGEEEYFRLYVSDCEVRRPQSNESFELAYLDKVATKNLREYLAEKHGKKYMAVLNEFENPIQAKIIT